MDAGTWAPIFWLIAGALAGYLLRGSMASAAASTSVLLPDVEMQPGDRLVVSVDSILSEDQYAQLRDWFVKQLATAGPIVVDRGLRLQVLRATENPSGAAPRQQP